MVMKWKHWSHEVWCCRVLNEFTSVKCVMQPLVHIILVTVQCRLKWHLVQKDIDSVLGKWSVISVELAVCVSRWIIVTVGLCRGVAWRSCVVFYTYSCLQGYFGHQKETSLYIEGLKFIGKQYVVKAPESGP